MKNKLDTTISLLGGKGAIILSALLQKLHTTVQDGRTTYSNDDDDNNNNNNNNNNNKAKSNNSEDIQSDRV